jgi:hypothetical protein
LAHVNIAFGPVITAKLRATELVFSVLRIALAFRLLTPLAFGAGHSRRSVHTAHRRAGFARFGISRLPRTFLAVLAAPMLKKRHRRFLVFCAVSAALCTRGTVRRLDRAASIEGSQARCNIDQAFFMSKAPRSALTWHSEVGSLEARRPITQIGCDVHHDILLFLFFVFCFFGFDSFFLFFLFVLFCFVGLFCLFSFDSLV